MTAKIQSLMAEIENTFEYILSQKTFGRYTKTEERKLRKLDEELLYLVEEMEGLNPLGKIVVGDFKLKQIEKELKK